MRAAAIAFSTNGCRILLRLKDCFDDITLASRTESDTLGIEKAENVDSWTSEAFSTCDAVIFVGALGIAVRHIAPYIRRKDRDPAVIGIDELGRFTVPLLSGHIGGGNEIALKIAESIGSTPVITTATDINGLFAVDVFATKNHLAIERLPMIKEISSNLLRGESVGFVSRIGYEGDLPAGLTESESGDLGICISSDRGDRPFARTMLLIPRDISVGVGCRKDKDPEEMKKFIEETLVSNGIDPKRIRSFTSIDIKSHEKAILALGEKYHVPVYFRTAEELMSLDGTFSGSEFVRDVTSVDCVCERSAVYSGGELILKKTARDGMTVALAQIEFTPRF